MAIVHCNSLDCQYNADGACALPDVTLEYIKEHDCVVCQDRK